MSEGKLPLIKLNQAGNALKKPPRNKSLHLSNKKLSDSELKNIKIITELGLYKASQNINILANAGESGNSYSRICMADFLGEKNKIQLECLKKNSILKKRIHKTQFIEEIKGKTDLRRPTSPHCMDGNTQLRLIIEKNCIHTKKSRSFSHLC